MKRFIISLLNRGITICLIVLCCAFLPSCSDDNDNNDEPELPDSGNKPGDSDKNYTQSQFYGSWTLNPQDETTTNLTFFPNGKAVKENGSDKVIKGNWNFEGIELSTTIDTRYITINNISNDNKNWSGILRSNNKKISASKLESSTYLHDYLLAVTWTGDNNIQTSNTESITIHQMAARLFGGEVKLTNNADGTSIKITYGPSSISSENLKITENSISGSVLCGGLEQEYTDKNGVKHVTGVPAIIYSFVINDPYGKHPVLKSDSKTANGSWDNY